ncbi:cell division protein FtsQ/DivIB [Faunimonas sp. B44]|uniref:cell division protein FtsQ/DivIB n=1 Tax=Faunimonas sp. B44 TaxID=3461493 RepID=UPI004043A2D5
MPALGGVTTGAGTAVARLDAALGRLGTPVAALMPRRLRRIMEKIETQRTRPVGQKAAAAFLGLTVAYGVTAGGHVPALVNAALLLTGFGVEEIRIAGATETPERAVLEALDLRRTALPLFDAGEARERLAGLPWVSQVTVRKLYPNGVAVDLVERIPYALWQDEGEINIVDREGDAIMRFRDRRYARLPFVVGPGANLKVAAFWPAVESQPMIAERTRAAVLVANRRWDLHLEHGLVLKLPERDPAAALAGLVALEEAHRLLDRDLVEIDLRVPERMTVRLPQGQPMPGEKKDPKGGRKVAGART